MITVRKKHKPYSAMKRAAGLAYLTDCIISDSVDKLNVWVTSSGDYILLKDLRKSHIHSILIFMSSRPGWRAEYKPALETELIRREKTKLAKKSKAGKLFYADV